jgi:hypothetical protein
MISIFWLIPIVLFCLAVGWQLHVKWVEAQTTIDEFAPPERIPMRNRFEPEVEELNDFPRQMDMADQILGDQAEVHETHGRTIHAPAPGERGYEEPRGRLIYKCDDSLLIVLSRPGFAEHIHYDGFGLEIERKQEQGLSAVALSRLTMKLALQEDDLK